MRDSVGLEPVSFAEVRVSSIASAARTATGLSDRFGAFAIPNAPRGPVRVEARGLGYAPWSREYDEAPTTPITILLQSAPIVLDSLAVEAGGRRGDPISVSRDAFVVDPDQIRALPAVLETDVLRTIAMSPSASAPSDFVSVPFVRGGTSEGTPLLLDGVRLFNPFHLGGFGLVLAIHESGPLHPSLLQARNLPATREGRDRIGSVGPLGVAARSLSPGPPRGRYVERSTRG